MKSFKGKYITITEDSEKRRIDVYTGYCFKEDKESVTAIYIDPDYNNDIQETTFLIDDWTIEETNPEEVRHLFDLAVLESQKKCMEAEIELKRKKFRKMENEKYAKQVFGN